MTLTQDRMRRALIEARKGLGRTSPNPAVGAVIERDGQIIATGWHEKAGQAHAEIVALRAAGEAARGATLYSTLEPCVHHGRTGPCTETIIASGITKVVVGAIDPNPRVRGKGIERLRSAGLEVESGVLEGECTALNEAFNHAIVAGRSFVVAKAGVSLDGKIATRTGHSQWITNEASRQRARALRAELDAIIVGAQTIIADDPQLTSRIEGAHDPLRVILDSRLRTPQAARVVTTAKVTPTLIFTTEASDERKRLELEAHGVRVEVVAGEGGRVRLEAAIERLHSLGLNGLLIEGGASVIGSAFDRNLVDKLILFVAPMIIGGPTSLGFVGGPGIDRLTEARRFSRMSVEQLDGDLVITAYR